MTYSDLKMNGVSIMACRNNTLNFIYGRFIFSTYVFKLGQTLQKNISQTLNTDLFLIMK